MNIGILLVAIAFGLIISTKGMPLLVFSIQIMTKTIRVLVQLGWLLLLGLTAVALLSFWNIGLEFSGLSLITAVAGLMISVWVWGKTSTWRTQAAER